MFRSNISEKLKWVLVLGLALLLLTTFISCGGDLVGPRLHDDKEPDDPTDEEQKPDEGGGSASRKQVAQPDEDTAALRTN
jgi:hypothetical protein